MEYKIGSYIGDNSKAYFLQCILLTDFQDTVQFDDIIYTYRRKQRIDYIIREKIFKGFSNCEYQGQDSVSCKHCTGRIIVINVNNYEEEVICPGWASGKQSCILKIIKNTNMKHFEEKDFEI